MEKIPNFMEHFFWSLSVVITFKQLKLFVSCVLVKDTLWMVTSNKVILFAWNKKGWYKAAVHVINGVKVKYVKLCSRLYWASHTLKGYVGQKAGQSNIIIDQFLGNKLKLAKRWVQNHSCNRGIPVSK